jgi:hypothetical protein
MIEQSLYFSIKTTLLALRRAKRAPLRLAAHPIAAARQYGCALQLLLRNTLQQNIWFCLTIVDMKK